MLIFYDCMVYSICKLEDQSLSWIKQFVNRDTTQVVISVLLSYRKELFTMRLYRPKSDYIQYLFDRDKRIINSENTIGVPIRLNELIYFLPIDSPSVSDYEDGVLKKSSPTIMRMFDLKTKIYLGKCLFSNMFSVPYKESEVVNITDFDEEKFVFVEKKLEYIKRNHDRIMKSAKMLFKQKSRKL